jgi:ACT domain-containing protein
MMMIVDSNNSPKNFEQLATELEQIGDEIGVIIKTQHEDIFNKMHRL